MTINNLKRSNQAITHYVEKNKKNNSSLKMRNKKLILSQNFFKHPYEIVFRSLSDSIKFIGARFNSDRGKKIDKIIKKIAENTLNKETLGGCVIKKVNQTVILTKENQI